MTGTNPELMREIAIAPTIIGILIRWTLFFMFALLCGATWNFALFTGLFMMLGSYPLLTGTLRFWTNEKEKGHLGILVGLLLILISFGIFLWGTGMP